MSHRDRGVRILKQPKEAALLNSGEYQDKLAYTIHMGIMEYLNKKQ